MTAATETPTPESPADLSRARKVVIACYLGWALDAFDFFIMVFVFSNVAKEFGTSITAVTVAVTLTLALRPVGAFIFGRIADRYGRRPALMLCILCFSVLEFGSGLAPNLASFLVLRGLFGIAMGGEWGIGSSLTMETIPVRWRGWVSGLLQSGYPTGYFLATLTFYLFEPLVGWRGLFMIGALPALLVVFISRHVEESPDWQAQRKVPRLPIHVILRKHAGLAIYAVILMTAFNFFAHGTQDIYPNVFLGIQHGFDHGTVTVIALVYNAGAAIGCLLFGTLSQKLGRRRAIMLAAMLSLPVIPLWAFSETPVPLAIGALLMQICVQGAWGVIPAHLNELSPPTIRATFPGFVYQLGNLLASSNATLQAGIGESMGNNYSWALAGVAGTVAVLITVLIAFGPEARDVKMSGITPVAPE
jgi:MFS transporter, SHS family, lactate transporter